MPRFDEPAELDPTWNTAAQLAFGPASGVTVVALDYGGTLTDPRTAVLPQLGMRSVTPAAAQAVQAVHALRVGLVLASNTPGTSRRNALAHAGILNLFQAIIESHRIGVEKPSIPFYSRVLRAVRCAPAQILFVGNNPHHDVRVPLELGMRAAHVGGDDVPLPPRAHRLPTIGHLPGLVEALCT